MSYIFNISRNKEKQALKFGQLLEYKIRNVFIAKSYNKMWWRNYCQTFKKKKKLRISLDEVHKFVFSFFPLYVHIKGYQNIFKLRWGLLLFPFIRQFYKVKSGLELVSLTDFLHDFWRKIFLLLYPVNWPNFGQYVYCNCF